MTRRVTSVFVLYIYFLQISYPAILFNCVLWRICRWSIIFSRYEYRCICIGPLVKTKNRKRKVSLASFAGHQARRPCLRTNFPSFTRRRMYQDTFTWATECSNVHLYGHRVFTCVFPTNQSFTWCGREWHWAWEECVRDWSFIVVSHHLKIEEKIKSGTRK